MTTHVTRYVDHAEQYLAERRAMGFELRIAGKRLLAFARFADQCVPNGPLTISTAVEWAQQARQRSPVTWARRIEIVRPFARYLTREKGVAVIPISVFYREPPEQRIVRFCFAKEDRTLEQAADRLLSV